MSLCLKNGPVWFGKIINDYTTMFKFVQMDEQKSNKEFRS